MTVQGSGGASSVGVSFTTSSGLSASAVFRVFGLVNAYAQATRYTLRALGCGFETATLFAYASLTFDGVTSIATADVTPFVTWTSSSTSVATVSGRVVSGVGAGSAVISVSGGTASVPMIVSSTKVNIVRQWGAMGELLFKAPQF